MSPVSTNRSADRAGSAGRAVTRPRQVLSGLVALAVLLGTLVGVPVLLAVLGGNPLPDHLPTLSEAGQALTSPDDGSLFLRVLTVVGWIGWATFALSVLVEVPAAVRRRPAPKLPGLRAQQRIAATLIAGVALLGASGVAASAATPVAAPATATVTTGPVTPTPWTTQASPTPGPATLGSAMPGSAMPGSTVPGSTVPGSTVPGSTVPGSTVPGSTVPGSTVPGSMVPGLVVPGSGVPGAPAVAVGSASVGSGGYSGTASWSSAVARDALPPLPVRAVSHGADLGGTPGTAVRPMAAGGGTYVVAPGDRLADVAGRFLGDPDRFPELARVNGLSDADEISPGQRIVLPPDARDRGASQYAAGPVQKAGDSYVIAPGDRLSDVAERFLGDADRYPELATGSGVRDPDAIRPGQRIQLPPDANDRGAEDHASGRVDAATQVPQPRTPSPTTPTPTTPKPSTPNPGHPSPKAPTPSDAAPSTPAPGHAAPSTPASGHDTPGTPAPGRPAPSAPATPPPGRATPGTPAPGHAAPSDAAPSAPSTPAPGRATPGTPAPGHAAPSVPAPSDATPSTPATPPPGRATPGTPAPGHAMPGVPAPSDAAPSAPVTPAPGHAAPSDAAPSAPATPAPGRATPGTPAPGHAAPSDAAPSAPSTPAPGRATPGTPAPGHAAPSDAAPSAPATPAPGRVTPGTPAPGHAAPGVPAPSDATPSGPSTPAPGRATPSTPAPGHPAPSAPAPGDTAPAPGRTAPAAPAPAAPAPAAPAPAAPAPAAPAPAAPAPATPAPASGGATQHELPQAEPTPTAHSEGLSPLLPIGVPLAGAGLLAALLLARGRREEAFVGRHRRHRTTFGKRPPTERAQTRRATTIARDGFVAAPPRPRSSVQPQVTPHKQESPNPRLDAALRALSTGLADRPADAMPDVLGAWIDNGTVRLVLDHPCPNPPAPWTSTDRGWELAADDELPDTTGIPAPLPMLVTVGTKAHAHLLLDVERLGVVTLTGDEWRADDLLRHIGAELAGNPWSDDLEILVAGFDSEQTNHLAMIGDGRIEPVPTIGDGIARMRRRVSQALGLEAEKPGRHAVKEEDEGDEWAPTVLLAADPDLEETIALGELDAELATTGRCGVGVVASIRGDLGRWPLQITGEGAMSARFLREPELLAARLSPPRLAGLAELFVDSALQGP